VGSYAPAAPDTNKYQESIVPNITVPKLAGANAEIPSPAGVRGNAASNNISGGRHE
jgi:hypothetical protein